MKATKIFAIIMMALLMVATPSYAQKRKDRKAAEKAAWDARQQFIKDSTERANKARLDAMDRNAAKNSRKEEQDAAKQPVVVDGYQAVYQPCYEEAIDKPGEYMAGYGISRPRKTQADAYQEVNDMATNDIASRFMGVIKHGTEYYSQSGSTDGGKDIDESDLERITLNLVKKTIDKYASQACFLPMYNKESNRWIYYKAIHINIEETVDEIADKLDKVGVLKDKQRFKENVISGLEADSKERAAELEKQLKMLE